MKRCRIWLVLAAVLAGPLLAQVALVRKPAKGRVLVASKSLGDPNFLHTVVLLAHYDEEGAMGVILNRPTDAPLRRMFPRAEPLKDRDDPLYEGGPVMPTGAVALVRFDEKPEEGAKFIRDDIYLVGDLQLLEKAVNEGKGPLELRVYLGYAGWGPGQLDREIAMGAWHVFEVDLATIFDPVPETLWRRLIRKVTERIVWLRVPIAPAD